ncbi:unnamed protein product [Mytilus coruscus]|uniref:PHD-type domain-containing protein n=1 Tax=Mytilus coruscus TaxID=42192 RepID=A0A6J8AGD0_MYTCO|nr:unnamed protein product [Mytilus coruscus]
MSTSKQERFLEAETPNLHGIKQYTPILLADSKGYQLFNKRNYNTKKSSGGRQDEYAIAVGNGLHKSTSIVETRFRIYNIKRDGSIGNQHKYTINCYKTTSRILVNGVKTDKFAENVLPIILELITSNESELDCINNNIQRSLQPIEVNQWSNISPNKDNTNVTEPRITQNSIEYTQISQAETQQNVTIYFCLICNERAGECTVACEQCDEWIHFNCAGLKDSDIDKTIHLSVAYVLKTTYIVLKWSITTLL